MRSLLRSIDAYFGVTAARSSLATETRAGLTTFLTMSYILFVNPMILSGAIQWEGESAVPQLMTATALAAAFGTLVMGLWSKYPYALAPGMGLNAYFTYTVVQGQGISWQTALGAVFWSGLLFLLISLMGIREKLIRAIPLGLKHAITAGVGCFLAMIGLVNSGLVTAHPVTLVTMGDIKSPGAVVAIIGFMLTASLLVFRIRGALLIGVLGATLYAVVSGAPVYDGGAFEGFKNGLVGVPAWPVDLFLSLDLMAALELGALAIIFTFLFVDFFDTTGTLIGLSDKAGVLDGRGRLPKSRAAFTADAAATTVGALLGTSSTTSYIESAAGIEEGGKTGLTAVVVALFFGLSLFFWPVAGAVPTAAVAPVLVIIGALMMFTTAKIQWDDYRESLPALLTILGMPLTYSITDGISMGLITHTAIHLLTGQYKRVHWLAYLMSALLAARYVFLAAG